MFAMIPPALPACFPLVFAQVANRPAPPTEGEIAAGAAGGVVLLLGMACSGFVFLLAYFLPTFIAFMRRHQNAPAIIILNVFLGWTFLGWVVALVWSFTEVTTEPPQRRRQRHVVARNPFGDE